MTIKLQYFHFISLLINQLFRSIIQASSRSKDGLIKWCKVRDHLRYLAMHHAKQENFVTIFSKASDDNTPNREIQRASFQSYGLQLTEYVGPNARFNHMTPTMCSFCCTHED